MQDEPGCLLDAVAVQGNANQDCFFQFSFTCKMILCELKLLIETLYIYWDI